MGLRNLIRTATVDVPGSEGFTVRGFSPRDGLSLYLRHSGELSALFEQFAAKTRDGQKVEPVDVTTVGNNLIVGAPRIMAEIITIATGMKPDHDEFEEEVEAASDLPAGIQMEALHKIGVLTFTSDMPPKKFLAVVLSLAQSATAALTVPAA